MDIEIGHLSFQYYHLLEQLLYACLYCPPLLLKKNIVYGQGPIACSLDTSELGFQGLRKLEKHLNLEGFLEKSLKIKSP